MNLSHQGQPHERENVSGDVALVVPLETLDRTLLPVAGGKAANLGELIRAGLAVPAGFCVTTAAYARVSTLAGLDGIYFRHFSRRKPAGAALRGTAPQHPPDRCAR